MKPQDALDERDTAILAHRQANLLKLPGPNVGDFVVMPDDTVARITYCWPGQVQLNIGFSGRFYLGDYGCSYSGGLSPSVPTASLTRTGGLKPGAVWFFHHNQRKAHNGIDATATFRVWRYTPATQ